MAGRCDRTDPGRAPIQRLPVLISVVNAQRLAQHQMVRMEVVEVPATGRIAPVGRNLVELVAFAGGNADLGAALLQGRPAASLVAVMMRENHAIHRRDAEFLEFLADAPVAAVDQQCLAVAAIAEQTYVDRAMVYGKMLAHLRPGGRFRTILVRFTGCWKRWDQRGAGHCGRADAGTSQEITSANGWFVHDDFS